LTWRNGQRYSLLLTLRQRSVSPGLVTITLNGEPYQLDGPVSVSTLLATLAIDSRRVAVEHNLVVVRRALFDSTIVREGDAVEIVNFVGGGAPGGRQHRR
jgi:thiamine biosynthesis protein ThiS